MPSQDGPAEEGQIVVCGERHRVAWKVVNFLDDENFSAYKEGCYRPAPGKDPRYPFKPAPGLAQVTRRWRTRRDMGNDFRDLGRLQGIIRQFVIHHDGLFTSDQCFHVLHDERGLSSHFLIDNDGTIIQTLDLAHAAFHAGGVNEISIGAELCNRGLVKLDGPDAYSKHPGFQHDPEIRDRGHEEVTIHGSVMDMWSYTKRQLHAMVALGHALRKIFPNLPQVYPRDDKGPIRTTLQSARDFAGYLGHFHVDSNKWDPGCFDFEQFVREIRVRNTWFVCLSDQGQEPRECARAPEIAEEQGPAKAQADGLLWLNENHSPTGGYFPVGPFGESRLWHGGIHLSLPQGAPVFCPFPGRVVAARQCDDAPTGSVNFVLTRHSYTLAGQPIRFFLLFYHLGEEDPGQQSTPWMFQGDQQPWWANIVDKRVAFPEIDVQSGEIIGHVGRAGPPDSEFEPQIHVEVMATEELGQKLQPGYWKAIDAGAKGRLCGEQEILKLMDRPAGQGDGRLSRGKLARFFQHGAAAERDHLRRLAVRFPSEWGGDAKAYESELLSSPDFSKLSLYDRNRLINEQIAPSLWWDKLVAQRTGLPPDFIVWHYHPIRFLLWMNDQLHKQAVAEPSKEPPAQHLMDDQESSDGALGAEDQEGGQVMDNSPYSQMSQEAQNARLFAPKDPTAPPQPQTGSPAPPPPGGCTSNILRRFGVKR